MREFATAGNLDVWYTRVDESDVFAHLNERIPAAAVKRFQKNLVKARGKDSLKALRMAGRHAPLRLLKLKIDASSPGKAVSSSRRSDTKHRVPSLRWLMTPASRNTFK